MVLGSYFPGNSASGCGSCPAGADHSTKEKTSGAGFKSFQRYYETFMKDQPFDYQTYTRLTSPASARYYEVLRESPAKSDLPCGAPEGMREGNLSRKVREFTSSIPVRLFVSLSYNKGTPINNNPYVPCLLPSEPSALKDSLINFSETKRTESGPSGFIGLYFYIK